MQIPEAIFWCVFTLLSFFSRGSESELEYLGRRNLLLYSPIDCSKTSRNGVFDAEIQQAIIIRNDIIVPFFVFLLLVVVIDRQRVQVVVQKDAATPPTCSSPLGEGGVLAGYCFRRCKFARVVSVIPYLKAFTTGVFRIFLSVSRVRVHLMFKAFSGNAQYYRSTWYFLPDYIQFSHSKLRCFLAKHVSRCFVFLSIVEATSRLSLHVPYEG